MAHMLRYLVFVLVCFSATSGHAGQQDYPFKIFNQPDAGKQIVMAQNKGPAPILLKLDLTPVNAIVEPGSPIVVVVKPDETARVAAISGKNAGQGYRVASSFKFSLGDPHAVPEGAENPPPEILTTPVLLIKADSENVTYFRSGRQADVVEAG